MTSVHILGFPRIGKMREMKKVVEAYWQGKISQQELLVEGKKIREYMWGVQSDSKLDFVQVGDFAWYDGVLNWSATLGVIPERFGNFKGKTIDLDTIFRIGRGRAPSGKDAAASSMKKWFDTNYHYMAPELTADQEFALSYFALFDEIKEAQNLGHKVKPFFVGPLTYLYLSKTQGSDFNKLDLLDKLLVAYEEVLQKLVELNIEWVQIDEPILVLDLEPQWQEAFKKAYDKLSNNTSIKILLATYFGKLKENLALATSLNVAGLHVDAVRGESEVNAVAEKIGDKVFSVGVVNGRNIWRNDLSKSLALLKPLKDKLADRLWISSSCSLLHSPVDLATEVKMSAEIKEWLAFAVQKTTEIKTLALALEGNNNVNSLIQESDTAATNRKNSSLVTKESVQQRLREINDSMINRQDPYPVRAKLQQEKYNLPKFPTTTIGSFPQTKEIRKNRRDFKKGIIDESAYIGFLKEEIAHVVKKQEEYDLDVLVHGEPERNDMVEYFGELMEGYVFSEYGWVQSYGSRCVKPPIIYGDILRPKSMTVEWSKYAQSLTRKKMKGMLTGPVTMLCWSFVRDDLTREQVCYQLALAVRDEVLDLEKAGIDIIQIDEAALREGLPLRRSEWVDYLRWAIKSFRLTANGVANTTQIHTHMCYSEFNDIIESIAEMDADVITIETSRSNMELLDAFENFHYPNEIGPGVYDIHSPRIPDEDWIIDLMKKAVSRIPVERLWVNPDCGLKTRGWEETEISLKNMVNAAKNLRETVV